VSWRKAPPGASSFGLLHIDALHTGSQICSVAATCLESGRAGRARLLVGAAGAVRAYFNGEEVLRDAAYRRAASPDRNAVRVEVARGPNRLVVVVCSDESGNAALRARLVDPSGDPWPLEANAALDGPLGEDPHGKAGRHAPVVSSLEAMMARASRGSHPPRMTAAVRYAMATGATHPGSHEVRNLARRACELAPGDDTCLAWAAAALDRNERIQAVSMAVAASPDSPEARIASARLLLEGPRAHDARAEIDAALDLDPDNREALVLRARLDAIMGFPLVALEAMREAGVQRGGGTASILAAAKIAEEARAAKEALRLAEAASASDWSDVSMHQILARSAAARGDREVAREQIAALEILASHDRTNLWEIAALRQMLSDRAGAIEALERAVALAPNDADSLILLGNIHLSGGDREAGLDLLTRARSARPQDAWLNDYLDLLDTSAPFWGKHVVPPKEFLGLRGKTSGDHDARYLVDNTVVKVLQTGLSSRFTQVVVEVSTREAARDWRQHSVQFSPDTQRARLVEARVFRPDGTVEEATGRGIAPISEPWYRLYYDLAAEVVELPPLAPGDVVEFSFAVDDTANQNAYADYFGDLIYPEESIPKGLWRYVLISPGSRRIHSTVHGSLKIHREEISAGGGSVEVFEAREVPAAIEEPGSTGETAGLSYLHLSTYSSWDHLGAWYRGLVRNQMIPDNRIRKTARDLVRGLTTTEEKVAAIYGWVVSATRYVGLEFGIHGYKPYRAPLVVSRGFGDCKDKASLLVTMLETVGVDAEFALVRTRSLGPIERTPASLSVFNHAIAHVPSIDLWLDGTAEHHGSGELPFQDQGIMALLLTEDGVRLTTTPYTAPDENRTRTRTRVILDPDGDAKMEVETITSGALGAPSLRKQLGTERTRRERFEGSLVNAYPGARLGELEIDGLEDPERPLEYRFDAFVPGFARASDDALRIPADSGLGLVRRYARLARRRLALEVGPARSSSRELVLEVPSGFETERLPSTTVIRTRFGSLSLKVEDRGSRIVVKREFELDATVVSPADYRDFVEFCREVDDALAEDVSLRRTR